ncbi:odorant receptor 85c-like [Hermetia illucens]|uniref:odorant receptor 85c-like n=1 Tax=Hermetia illucens TaxID=343691 RepID=UPI0018CC52D8|nr:odorant receptor 85c-like [Hermetia illucens]
MGSQVKTVQFSHFMAVALGLYKTMGIDTFTSQVKYGTLDRFIQVVILHLGTWNLILIIIGEIIYLLKSFGSFENFLQITAVLPCIGLCVGSMGKILTVWNKKTQVKTILSQLEGIFPRNLVEQEKFQVETYRKHITKMIIPLTVVTMFALWVFNLYELFDSSVYYFRNRQFQKVYPYFVWYPFDDQTNVAYPLVYLHQCYAGYVAVGSTLATDLLLCCIINQLRMHFDFISRQIAEIVPKGRPNDVRIVKHLIEHHITILRISDEVNDVFGLSTLYIFVSSSLIICLTGFQVSAGVTDKDLVKYILFLAYELFTVFVVCYHGNYLIDSGMNNLEEMQQS